ncbi:MAG TPA: nucleoside-diphosphate kinase [Verrucomicrobiales bacterium]|nr:nucleoside-diphosphate kinase [Verrucomicrobiales bacterium]
MSVEETSLILLKPDCVTKGHCGEVLRRFEKEGFIVRGMKMMELTEELLRDHYAHVAGKPFFPSIVAFMQSSPVVAIALSGPDVVQRVRDLLGPTDSAEAPAGTIRGDMGENKMVNVAHASDSIESAEGELKRFFRPEEIFAPAIPAGG